MGVFIIRVFIILLLLLPVFAVAYLRKCVHDYKAADDADKEQKNKRLRAANIFMIVAVVLFLAAVGVLVYFTLALVYMT